MIIYKDRICGSELFTDALGVKEEDAFFVFKSKIITRKEGEIDDSKLGANASAEEAQEQCESGSTTGLEFVLNAKLHEGIVGSKKDFTAYLKDYVKKLQDLIYPECQGMAKGEVPDEVKEFQKRANTFAMKLIPMVKDLVVYYGEDDESFEGSCCFARYLEDGMSCEVYAFKDGVICEKC